VTTRYSEAIALVSRGGRTESRHHGAFAVSDANGTLVASAGDVDEPVFPRSAIKAFQALPVIESGAADRFGFTDEEVALLCSSHNGEPRHVATALGMLKKVGLDASAYECGVQEPGHHATVVAMYRAGAVPGPEHNNCSGKHAGMLALARQLGADPHHYVSPDHPVQQTIARTMGEMCGVDLGQAARGIDGCSVPTWAIPLKNLALGFARFATGDGLAPERAAACRRIIAAVRAHPFMVAGTGRYCTRMMTAVPRLFVKTGAEGVFCGAIPHAGLGFALKCADGATRGSEAMATALLSSLDVWSPQEHDALAAFLPVPVTNRAGTMVGEITAELRP